MKPRELVQRWVDAFNRADADELSFLRLQGLPLATEWQQRRRHPKISYTGLNQRWGYRIMDYIGAGIAIGAGVGAAIGVAMKNIGMGVGIGIAIGAAIGASIKKKDD